MLIIITVQLVLLLGWHGSASLCRDGQKTGYNASISVQTPNFNGILRV